MCEISRHSSLICAGSSPVLQRRKASTHLGHAPSRGPSDTSSWRNPFSNLRRTQSHKTPPTQRAPHRRQPLEIVNSSRLQGPAHSSAESLGVSSTSSSPGHEARHPQVVRHHLELETASRNTNSNNEQCGSHIAATPTSLPSEDTDSLRTFGSERTLVEGGGSVDTTDGGTNARIGQQQNLFLSLPPSSGSRHKQTCSSVDSEGLGSLASEEIEEAGPSDWTLWSKEVCTYILQWNLRYGHSEEWTTSLQWTHCLTYRPSSQGWAPRVLPLFMCSLLLCAFCMY